MTLPEGLIVSVSGIRGRVGLDLSPDVIAGVAAAFGTFVRRRGWGDHLIVGRDSRPSGEVFAAAAIAGLRSVGCRVSDLGLVPTPTALLAIEERGLAGGIVVTASHNPREWNALKLASRAGAFLAPDEGSEFVDGLRAGEPPEYAGWDGFGGIEPVGDAVDRHIERILDLEYIDPDLISSRGFEVALDCTRGAGGVILPRLLEALGCEIAGLDLETDGRFRREPEPTASNLGELSDRVRSESADLGMAVDPDVDRLALVDETGQPIGEDLTLALAARLVLSHRKGPVVTNLSTSQVVAEVCERAGVMCHRTPVGEANVAAGMREVGAVIGGEGNGGVILPALHYTRDAPLAAALILQLLAETGSGLGRIVAEYPQFCTARDRLPRPDLEVDQLYAEIQDMLPAGQVDRRDGLHLNWPDRRMWVHVRPSGTEPILRILAEGPADGRTEVLDLVDRIKQRVARRAGG